MQSLAVSNFITILTLMIIVVELLTAADRAALMLRFYYFLSQKILYNCREILRGKRGIQKRGGTVKKVGGFY